MAERTVVANSGNASKFKVEFKDRDVSKTAEFTGPSSPKTFKSWVQGLSDVETDGYSEVSDAYDEIMYALETHAKQREREQVAAESTVITRDGRKIDLMEIAVNKAILVINAGFAMASATETAPPNALAAARKKWLETGKVKEVNEALVAA